MSVAFSCLWVSGKFVSDTRQFLPSDIHWAGSEIEAETMDPIDAAAGLAFPWRRADVCHRGVHCDGVAAGHGAALQVFSGGAWAECRWMD